MSCSLFQAVGETIAKKTTVQVLKKVVCIEWEDLENTTLKREQSEPFCTHRALFGDGDGICPVGRKVGK